MIAIESTHLPAGGLALSFRVLFDILLPSASRMPCTNKLCMLLETWWYCLNGKVSTDIATVANGHIRDKRIRPYRTFEWCESPLMNSTQCSSSWPTFHACTIHVNPRAWLRVGFYRARTMNSSKFWNSRPYPSSISPLPYGPFCAWYAELSTAVIC